MYSAQWLDTDY